LTKSFARLKCTKFIFDQSFAPDPSGDITLSRFPNRLVGEISGGFKERAKAGGGRPLLTGCILKQVKILHDTALFLPKILKKNSGEGAQTSPLIFPSPIRNFWIHRWVKYLHYHFIQRRSLFPLRKFSADPMSKDVVIRH